MGILKNREVKEKLKEFGLDINKRNIKVFKILNGERTPRNFWTKIENFKAGVKIATRDIGYNSLEALRKEKERKYKPVVSAFQRHREKWYDRKIKWEEILEDLGIEYKPRNIRWTTKKAVKKVEDKNIRSWDDLNKKSPRLKQAILRGSVKESLRELIEMSKLEHKWTKENFIEYLKENKINSYKDLKGEAKGVYTKHNQEWGDFYNLVKKAGLTPERASERRIIKKMKEKQKLLKEKKKLSKKEISKTVEETSKKFCPNDGNLLNRPKRIDGHLYKHCSRCGKWYKIVKK
ncbi:MAG: hypothetical protein R6U26_00035 [Candidatus Undinarchaeales archaeon]